MSQAQKNSEQQFSQLVEIMIEQADVYDQMLSLSEEERSAIKSHEVTQLMETTEAKEKLLGKIKDLENARAAVIGQLAGQAKTSGDKLTVHALYDQIADPVIRSSLEAAEIRLSERLHALGRINEKNKLLIYASAEVVESRLASIAGVSHHAVYGAQGEWKTPVANVKTVFDYQA